jgi:hypothetical protein
VQFHRLCVYVVVSRRCMLYIKSHRKSRRAVFMTQVSPIKHTSNKKQLSWTTASNHRPVKLIHNDDILPCLPAHLYFENAVKSFAIVITPQLGKMLISELPKHHLHLSRSNPQLVALHQSKLHPLDHPNSHLYGLWFDQ